MELGFLNATFPFHFAVDPTLRITSVGSSLARIAPGFVVDAEFADLVELVTQIDGWKELPASSGAGASLPKKNPMGLSTANLKKKSPLGTADDSAFEKKPRGTMAAAGNFARLFSRQGEKFEVKLIEQAVSMRGQWASVEPGLAFVGVPHVKTHYDLSRFGIKSSDFPAHAMAMERIDATEKLASLVSKQTKTVGTEQALAYELTVAADLLLRQLDHHGRPIKMKFELNRENKRFYFEARMARSMNESFVLVGRDVTDHRRLEQRLTYIAHHDPLTRLANRGFFERCVQNVLQKSAPCAVMFIDMNEFKEINDRHGHPVGDEVLKAIADRLNGVCGIEDTPGRMGGDEFGVIVKNVTDHEQAIQVAARFVDAIGQPLELNGLTITPSASIGITIPDPGASIEVVYRNADVAMYQAKSDELEEDYAVFVPEMLDEFVNSVRLKRDFGRALSVGELDVHYQPIKSLMTGEWYGFESLVRWHHPTRGMLAPNEFLKLAEESGDLFTIGEQVLRLACTNARRITQAGRELMLTVNVSTAQLYDDRMVDMIRTVLAETGWSPRRLTLEISENALSEKVPETITILNGLRGLGIRIAIDDFGMGQSSLRYLEELPIDMIKLDRALMSRLDGEDASGSRLIESVIRLGHTFGFEIVAEGVERPVQEEIVKSFGCRYAQGYLYSKPMPVEHLAGLDGLEISLGVPAQLAPAAKAIPAGIEDAFQSR